MRFHLGNLAFALCLAAVILGAAIKIHRPTAQRTAQVDQAFVAATDPHEQKVQAAMWEVAKVFGRAPGCQDADQDLGRTTAETALAHEVDPKVVAATIAIESGCNPYATSSRGAIGLMQVMPSTWKGTYDFQEKVNLLNKRDNIQTGTDILAGYIKKFGKANGVTHYQGMGTGCPTCDGAYTSKILRLSEGK